MGFEPDNHQGSINFYLTINFIIHLLNVTDIYSLRKYWTRRTSKLVSNSQKFTWFCMPLIKMEKYCDFPLISTLEPLIYFAPSVQGFQKYYRMEWYLQKDNITPNFFRHLLHRTPYGSPACCRCRSSPRRRFYLITAGRNVE